MNSLGIFHDVQLKNNNNVLFSLKKACDQTSNLVDYMDNYQKPSYLKGNYNRNEDINGNLNNINYINNNYKKRNKSVITKIGKNIISNNNSSRFKKKKSEYIKKGGTNKYKNIQNKIFGNNMDNNYDYYEQKNNEVYNYNKQYENDLINDIENLFHPKKTKNSVDLKNLRDIMPNNYMDIFSLMGGEY